MKAIDSTHYFTALMEIFTMLNGHSMKPFSLLVLLMALSCQAIGFAEVVDIPSYREEIRATMGSGSFKGAVISDLTRRRDTHCDREGYPDSV